MDQGESKESENKLKKEYKFEIQETMHSQYKYKGDNFYLSFHEHLCRFNQNKINCIMESASDELITRIVSAQYELPMAFKNDDTTLANKISSTAKTEALEK